MPKVRVKEVYFDKVLDTYKEKVGEEFEVEEKRADVLVNAGVCELVVEEQDEKEASEEETTEEAKKPKKTTKKAKAETK